VSPSGNGFCGFPPRSAHLGGIRLYVGVSGNRCFRCAHAIRVWKLCAGARLRMANGGIETDYSCDVPARVRPMRPELCKRRAQEDIQSGHAASIDNEPARSCGAVVAQQRQTAKERLLLWPTRDVTRSVHQAIRREIEIGGVADIIRCMPECLVLARAARGGQVVQRDAVRSCTGNTLATGPLSAAGFVEDATQRSSFRPCARSTIAISELRRTKFVSIAGRLRSVLGLVVATGRVRKEPG
jgi:hypothetical protein